MTEENNFPTVRTGSLWLLAFAGALVAAILYKASDLLVDALKAILTALGSTHAILVAGKAIIKSKWAGDAAEMTETVTTQKTVSKAPVSVDPASTTAQDVNINAENVNVSGS